VFPDGHISVTIGWICQPMSDEKKPTTTEVPGFNRKTLEHWEKCPRYIIKKWKETEGDDESKDPLLAIYYAKSLGIWGLTEEAERIRNLKSIQDSTETDIWCAYAFEYNIPTEIRVRKRSHIVSFYLALIKLTNHQLGNKSITLDAVEALALESALMGNINGMVMLADICAHTGRVDDMNSILDDAIALGSTHACFLKGATRDFKTDMKSAFEWWEKAAAMDNVMAIMFLANKCFHGDGCKQDKDKAMKYLPRLPLALAHDVKMTWAIDLKQEKAKQDIKDGQDKENK
jgi:hypothetical protein